MSVPERLAAALADKYTLERELGQGGMATVYLAQDLKHDRKVAVKVLKPELAAVVGGDRFVTEIRTTANLQHPHILPLFDSGEADSFLYYVMPYVEGETLRDKLDREKQLSVAEAIAITVKIAGALQSAHEAGVIHRDIKPGNILLAAGEPLVADFGIALAVQQAGEGRITETGLSLGTPYYMAPEQATGDRDPDARSDLYSLACMLYEMLTGEPPFSGTTAQAVLGRILTQPAPNVTDIRQSVPPHIGAVLSRGLQKLPADRFDSVAEFSRALQTDSYVDPTSRASGAWAAAQGGGPAWKRLLPWGVAAVMAAVALGSLAMGGVGGGSAADELTFRTNLDLSGIPANLGPNPAVAISPDGSMIAVVPWRNGLPDVPIWIRGADEADFRPIPNTEGASYPTFSPSGEWIAYVHTESNQLRKVTLSGGGQQVLVNEDGIAPFFAHWGTEDQITFVSSGAVAVASATTGAASDIVTLDAPFSGFIADPFLTPDGAGVLASNPTNGGIWYLPVNGDTARLVIPDGRHPEYVDAGEVLYVSPDGGLFSVPFDLASGETSGSPVRVLDGLAALPYDPGYHVAASGELIQTRGPNGLAGGFGAATQYRYLELMPGGDTVLLAPLPKHRVDTRLSDDGRYLAFAGGESTDARQIFTYDLVETDEEQLTVEGNHASPVFSPDGEWLVFTVRLGGAATLWITRADGSGEPSELLSEEGAGLYATDWTPDGDLVYDCFTGGAADVCRGRLVQEADAWTLEPDARPYLGGEWRELDAALAPQGDLLAHSSQMGSDTDELYVSTWPELAAPRRGTTRSTCCLGSPVWAPDGESVYFVVGAAVDSVLRIDVDRDPVRLRDPELVFASTGNIRDLNVFPDGRLLLNVPASTAAAAQPTGGAAAGAPDAVQHFLVVNWKAEYERKLAEAGR